MDRNSIDFVNGALLSIDKPYEWTSFDVVNKIRYQLRRKYNLKRFKVGHAGTLDPLATGLLLVCTGKWTKKIDTFQALEKEYTGTFRLGATTPSFDLETAIDHTAPFTHLTKTQIKSAISMFTGEIEQLPPTYSAVKVEGKRAYELARKGVEVAIKPRKVTVSEFELTQLRNDQIDFRIVCSKGTYIRSIARDLGEQLKCGAHLVALRRTRIGEHHLTSAIGIDEVTQLIEKNELTDNN
jgi:tRNA pseudouridine55 synthase